MQRIDANVHPTIKRCLTHLDVIGTDAKTKQLVYMYLEILYKELSEKSAKAKRQPLTACSEDPDWT